MNCIWFDALLARTDSRVLASRWLKEHVEPDATLHDAGSSYSRLDLRDIRYHAWSFDANSLGILLVARRTGWCFTSRRCVCTPACPGRSDVWLTNTTRWSRESTRLRGGVARRCLRSPGRVLHAVLRISHGETARSDHQIYKRRDVNR